MFANRSISRIFSGLFNLLVILSLGIGAVAFPVSARADNSIIVTTMGDNTDSDTFCSLREAITNANDDAATYADCAAGSGNDAITFDVDYTITLVGSQLPVITWRIVINGNGATDAILQANASSNTATYRVLEVGGTGNLTLNNLTVRNGVCNGLCATNGGWGGGILIDSGTLTVNASTVNGNAASYGAGINNFYGTLTIQNSSSMNANAASEGGGIYNNNGTTTVDASTVSANTALSGGGGITMNGGVLTIQNGSVIGGAGAGNSVVSTGYGGGIYIYGGTTTLDASVVTLNSATNQGGGIYNSGGTLTIQNSSTISGNYTSYAGGGIYNNNGTTATIDASSVSANRVTSGTGGGIYNNGTLTIKNGSTIGVANSGNYASYGAGGIKNNYNGILTISSSSIIGNSAPSNYGGGILNYGMLMITASTIYGNSSPNGYAVGGGVIGGGISNSGTTSITGSCVISNTPWELWNSSSTVQNATGNWWNSSTGPIAGYSQAGSSADWNTSGFLNAPALHCGGGVTNLMASLNGRSQ